MTFPRVARSTAVALALVLLAAGCVTPPPAPVESDAPTGFEEYFVQDVAWESCGSSAECASIDAPLDWSDASKGSIELALSRVTALGDSKGSILVNPGGPGGSGYDFVKNSISYAASGELLSNFDMVGWDPRGVGESSRVECLDGDAKDDLLFGEWQNAYDSDAWITELEAAEQTFVDACEANTGALLEFVDSASTANDMNLMRALLGEEKLNYLGYSYGTYFGAMFAELFPERVGRLVLDGALDPKVEAIEWFSVQMSGFDGAMNAFLEDCLDAASCAFSGTLADAQEQFTELLESMDDRELMSSDGRVLDSATLGFAVASALYSSSNWPTLGEMFVDVEAGDATLAFTFVDSYYGRSGDGLYANNSFEVYTATLCLDDDFQTDAYTVRDGLDAISQAAPLVGGPFAYDDYGHVETACTLWPYPPKQKPEKFDAAGSDPILVIGTTNDPATPYAWAVSLADQLESGVLVTYNGEGHTAYGRSNECITSAVDEYFINGTVPTSDPDC